MKKQSFRILITVLISLLLTFITNSQNCLQFIQEQCVKCSPNTHLFRGNCLFNIVNCQSYMNGFDCLACNIGFQLNRNKCIKVINIPANNKSNSTTSTSSTASASSTPSKQSKSSSTPSSKTSISYKQTILTLPLDPGSFQDKMMRASMSQDIFKAKYFILKNGKVTKALDILYSNGTKHSILEFQVKNKNQQTLYKCVMQTDLVSFIFQEISFQPVNINNTSDNKLQKNNQSNISLNSISSTQQTKSLVVQNQNQVVQKQNQNIKSTRVSQNIPYTQLSQKQASLDFLYIIGLNHIQSKYSDLANLNPTQIFVEPIYLQNPKLQAKDNKPIHYIFIYYIGTSKNNIQVMLHIEPTQFVVTIDSRKQVFWNQNDKKSKIMTNKPQILIPTKQISPINSSTTPVIQKVSQPQIPSPNQGLVTKLSNGQLQQKIKNQQKNLKIIQQNQNDLSNLRNSIQLSLNSSIFNKFNLNDQKFNINTQIQDYINRQTTTFNQVILPMQDQIANSTINMLKDKFDKNYKVYKVFLKKNNQKGQLRTYLINLNNKKNLNPNQKNLNPNQNKQNQNQKNQNNQNQNNQEIYQAVTYFDYLRRQTFIKTINKVNI